MIATSPNGLPTRCLVSSIYFHKKRQQYQHYIICEAEIYKDNVLELTENHLTLK